MAGNATIRLGVGLTQRYDPDLVRRAEALGFDSLWLGSHVLWRTPMHDPFSLLSAYAAITETITLGTCVAILPLYQPVTLAKTVATLDTIAGGRVVIGVGVGGENPLEFQACGIDPATRGARTDETIDVMRGLWTGREFRHQGRIITIPPVTMTPTPVQPGGPPIWIGGGSDAALRRAATRGDGWIGIFIGPERYRERAERVDELARAAGRNPDEITKVHYLWTRLGPSESEEREAARAYLRTSYGRTFDDARLGNYCAFGSSARVRARIEQYAEVGCSHFVLKPACTAGELPEQVERLGALVAGLR